MTELNDLQKRGPEEKGCWVGMDYLTISRPREEKPLRMLRVLMAQFESTGDSVHWGHGYEGFDICGGYGMALMRPCWDGLTGDVLVRLPGRALEWIRETNILSETDAQCTDADICRFFFDHEFKATRLDATIDTSDPAVNPKVVENLLHGGHYTSTAQNAGISHTWKLGTRPVSGAGQTVYIGGRSSTRYMRCYDKRAEVLKKLNKDIGHLTRFEIEHKGDAATLAMRLIAEKGAGCIPGIYRGWINFKDPSDTATRVERRRNVDWWERLVGEHEPITLGLVRGIATPEQSVHWLEHQVAKTLLLAKEHGFMPAIEQAMVKKAGKVSPSEKQKWSDYAARVNANRSENKREVAP